MSKCLLFIFRNRLNRKSELLCLTVTLLTNINCVMSNAGCYNRTAKSCYGLDTNQYYSESNRQRCC